MFQRTAEWMFPNPNYHEEVGPGVRWALKHLPFYGRWYRFLIFWPGCDKGLEAARVDPDYPDQQTAVSEMNDITRSMFTDWITSQVGDDPDLLAKVVPDYPATGKRTLQDNGSWLQTLTRDDVELVRTGIDHIEPDAIVTVDGARYGRRDRLRHRLLHTKLLFPMAIVAATARSSRAMGRAAGRLPRHHGARLPEPVLHVRAGHQPGHGGSLIFHSECQMRYISQCLDELIDGGHRTMEPRRQVRGVARALPGRDADAGLGAALGEALLLQERLRRDPRLSPWRIVDYWTWTRRADLGDFVFS